MKYHILIDQLKSLRYFDKKSMLLLGAQHGIKESTVNTYISRYLKRKELISLGKRGTYVTRSFYEKNKGELSYKFYLANVLRTPSYVSSWTALQYYNLTTEIIHDVISVTTNTTRSYQTKAGNFVYHSIKKDLSSGLARIQDTFDFFIATPARSLFDLLYFRTSQFQGVVFSDIGPLLDELRIDIEEMEKKEREKFYKLVKKYLNHE